MRLWPHDLLLPAGALLLKFLEPPKIAWPSEDKAFSTYNLGLTFRSLAHFELGFVYAWGKIGVPLLHSFAFGKMFQHHMFKRLIFLLNYFDIFVQKKNQSEAGSVGKGHTEKVWKPESNPQNSCKSRREWIPRTCGEHQCIDATIHIHLPHYTQ